MRKLDELINWLEYGRVSGFVAARESKEQEEHWASQLKDLKSMLKQILTIGDKLDVKECIHDVLLKFEKEKPKPKKKLVISGYRGVSWDARRKTWRAVLSDPWRHLGYFENEIQAAMAHDIEAKKLGYTTDRLNFPRGLDAQGKPL